MQDIVLYSRNKLKAPYEFLRIKYRRANHIVEYFTSLVGGKLQNFQNSLHTEDGLSGNLSTLEELIASMEDYIKKLEEIYYIFDASADNIILRVNNFSSLLEIDLTKGSQKYWPITNSFSAVYHQYLVCQMLEFGLYKTAFAYATKKNILPLVELELRLFDRMKEVEDGLSAGNFVNCLKWCKEQKSRLVQKNSLFHIKIRIYEFAQLIKQRKITAAISYAQKYFSNQTSLEAQELINKALCLFTCSNSHSELFSLFFSPIYLENLIPEFRKEYKFINGLSDEQTDFSSVLQCGIIALKTRTCGTYNEDYNCPTCSPVFRDLAALLPYPSRSTSVIKCRLLDRIVGIDDTIIMTPDGYVYSYEGVMKSSSPQGKSFICPRLSKKYLIEDCLRVYFTT